MEADCAVSKLRGSRKKMKRKEGAIGDIQQTPKQVPPKNEIKIWSTEIS